MGSNPQSVEPDPQFLSHVLSVGDFGLLLILVVAQHQFAVSGAQMAHAFVKTFVETNGAEGDCTLEGLREVSD